MAKAFGIITAASSKYHVEGMQDYRPIAAFSFVGRYRMVDFPISNMSNSGIDRVLVYVSGNPRSLAEHLGSGRLYNINSKRGRLQLLFHNEGNINRIYNTDIAAFVENIEHIERAHEEYVVIAPSNIIYTQDYDALVTKHIESGADVSLLYQRITDANDRDLGCSYLILNRQNGVQSIHTNMGNETIRNIFLETYVMKKTLLMELIEKARSLSSVYNLQQMLNQLLNELDVRAIQHKGYVAAVTDLKSYFDANLALLEKDQADSLFRPDWPVYTRTTDSCPTQFFEGASIKNSMISNGCSIEGSVENSVIGRGVKIGKGAVIKNCVILSYSEIAPDTVLEYQVVDKWAKILNAKEVIATPDQPGYVRRNDRL